MGAHGRQAFGRIGTANPSGQLYRVAAQADSDGQVLGGVRYARNCSGHQLSLATTLTWPIGPNALGGWDLDSQPLSFLLPVWRPLSDLPPPPAGRPDVAGQRAYSDHLAGQFVSDTLAKVASWFAKAEVDHL